jgi:hypothetical protein
MKISHREEPPGTFGSASLRMRDAIADAAFVADGVALGLLLKWAERPPQSDPRPPRVRTRRAADDGMPVSADP